jgi:probable DNA repair protein
LASPRTIPDRTIITGTVAAARQLVANHDAARRAEGHAVWESPDILPRDAWVRRLWEECAWNDPAATPVLLTRWQELALWEEAIQSTERDVLLNAHATARAAAEAWQLLHAWEAPLEALLEAPFGIAAFERTEDAAAFAMWMKRVQRRLTEHGWITAAELPRALHQRIALGTLDRGATPPELFGFDEIAPADRRLFDVLGATVRDAPACASEPQSAMCHDSVDELTRAAAWARHRLEARLPDQASMKIGVAIPGLAAVAAVAERIFDDILHPAFGFDCGARAFEISPGPALAASPMISTALLLLRLIDGLPREEAALLWRSPFLGIDREEGALLDIELRRAKADPVSLRTGSVARRFPTLVDFAARSHERARPSQWSEIFARAVSLGGWPGTRALTQTEAETAEAWKDLLSEFARLDSVISSLGRSGAISNLQRMAEAARLPRERGDAPVQILDIADTAGTRFEALWIAGLEAGAWPRRVQPNPFLPLALQRAANMPGSSADREFVYAQRVTARLFTSANEVVCSYPAHAAATDKSEPQQASPFLTGLPVLPEAPAYAGTALLGVFQYGPELEPRPPDANLALPPGTDTRGGSRVLANQSACPFRAFAVHRLGAKEMDEPDVGLSALDRGSLAHRVLELLWGELGTGERLNALPREALDALVSKCTRSALEKYFAKHDPSPALAAFGALEQARLERLIRKWLEIEKTRRPFTVAYNELECAVEVEGLRLNVRVDRIDRYADGTHAIVDYKTSKKLSADMWEGERPAEPQLPLYAITSEVDVSEVAFAQLATVKQGWISVEGAELKGLLPQWTAVVHKLAADFRNGHAEVDPREKPSPCDLCALHALCRIHEMKRLPREAVDPAETAQEGDG